MWRHYQLHYRNFVEIGSGACEQLRQTIGFMLENKYN